jgi:hypothetical protein
MEPVSMRFVLCVPVISAGMIGVALAAGGGPVAAADCLTEPKGDTPPGQHWYYHLDRGTDRKCWYLHATASGAGEAPAMELQSVRPPHRPIAAPAAPPQRRQAAPAPAAEPPQRQVAAPQRPAQRSEADEAALYLEFLRWKEQQRTAQ